MPLPSLILPCNTHLFRAHREHAKSATMGFWQLQTTWNSILVAKLLFHNARFPTFLDTLTTMISRPCLDCLGFYVFSFFLHFDNLRFEFSMNIGSTEVHHFSPNIFIMPTITSGTANKLVFDNDSQHIQISCTGLLNLLNTQVSIYGLSFSATVNYCFPAITHSICKHI